MMSRRKRLLLGLSLIILSGAFVAAYVLFYHPDTIKELALQQIGQVYGQRIRIGQIQISFVPHPKIELTDVSIGERVGDRPFFKASRIGVDLEVFPLLQEKIVPKHLAIERPEVTLWRSQEGQWSLYPASQGMELDNTVVGSFFLIPNLTLVNGQFTVIDEFNQAGPSTLVFDNVNLQFSGEPETQARELSLSARIPDGEGGSLFTIYGKIQEAASLLRFGQTTPDGPLPRMQLRARVELTNGNLRQLAGFFELQGIPLEVHGHIEIEGKIGFGPGIKGYDLVFSDLRFKTEAVSLAGEASVAGLMTEEPPTVFLNVTSQPVTLARLRELLPPQMVPPEFEGAMRSEALRGTLEVVSANVAGSAREGVGFSMVGEFRLDEGYLDLGETWGVAEGVSGTMFIQPDHIRLADFQGVLDSIPVRSGTGMIEFQETGPWLTTRLQGDVPAEKLLEILRLVFGWDDTSHPLSPLRGLGGSGDLTIQFAGPLHHPEEISFQDAVYLAEDVSLQVPGLVAPLSDLTGRVTFSQVHVGLDHVTGRLGDSEFEVEGNLRFDGTDRFEDVRLRGVLHARDIVAQWFDPPRPEESLLGTARLEATVSGPAQSPRIKVSLDLRKTGIVLPGVLQKALGLPGSLQVEVQVQKNGDLMVNRVDLSMLPVHLSGRGLLRTGPAFGIKASVTAKPVSLDVLPRGLMIGDGAIRSGLLELFLDVKGESPDWRQWQKNGWVALTDGVVTVKGLEAPLTNLFLRVKLTGHTAEVKRLEFRLKDSEARVVGTIQNWETHPFVKLTMTSPQFDIDLLIPKGERSPLRDFLEHVADTSRVFGHLHFDRAWYKELQFQDLTGRIRIQDGMVRVYQVKGKVEQGEVGGDLEVHLPKGRPATVKTRLDFSRVPVEKVWRSFIDEEYWEERLLTGVLSVQGTIEGHGHDARGVLPTVKGKVKIVIEDGRIQRGTVIPKILALMNLPTVLQGKVDLRKKGYPYDRQSATIDIDQGVMTSTDIVMDGPILKMTAAGNYDLVKGDLNLIAAVSPFGPYSDLLKKIPLFGLLLDGEREAIDTALFEIKGSVHNPDVQYLPLQSFKAGLTGLAKLAFNVLRNTITLPVKLLTPKDPTGQSDESGSQPSTQDSSDDVESEDLDAL